MALLAPLTLLTFLGRWWPINHQQRIHLIKWFDEQITATKVIDVKLRVLGELVPVLQSMNMLLVSIRSESLVE